MDQSQTPPEQSLKRRLETFSLSCGFVRMGICRPDSIPLAADRLADFVAQGHHGDMGWMADRMAWRGDPAALWPQARSVIMLAEAYSPQHDPLEVLKHRDHAAISVYAHGRDYHDLVKKRLKTVGRWLIDQVPGAEIKVFVDTAPVMEKPLAQAAGLGWQGQHTNLLGRDLGNISAVAYQGATVAFAKAQGCTVLIRGLRNAADLDAEFGMAQVNRANGLDTLFLVSDAAHQHLSSRLVKLVASAGLALDALVPPAVLAVLAPIAVRKPG